MHALRRRGVVCTRRDCDSSTPEGCARCSAAPHEICVRGGLIASLRPPQSHLKYASPLACCPRHLQTVERESIPLTVVGAGRAGASLVILTPSKMTGMCIARSEDASTQRADSVVHQVLYGHQTTVTRRWQRERNFDSCARGKQGMQPAKPGLPLVV